MNNLFRFGYRVFQELFEIRDRSALSIGMTIVTLYLMAIMWIVYPGLCLVVYWVPIALLLFLLLGVWLIEHFVEKITKGTVRDYLTDKICPEDIDFGEAILGLFVAISALGLSLLIFTFLVDMSLANPAFGFALLGLFTLAAVLVILYRVIINVGQKIWTMNQRLKSMNGDES